MTIVDRYAAIKESMALATGATEELLHIHFGLVIFVVVAVVFRRRMHSAWPVLLVWGFALANEAIDAFAQKYDLALSALDLLNTVLWPTVLFVVARRKRVSPALDGEY